MKKFIIAGTITLTLLLTLSGLMTAGAQNAANKSIAGDWQAIWNTPIGAMNCHYTFKVEGNTVTGKVIAEMNGNKSESEITEGKIDEDKIIFSWIYNNDVKMVCTGKITADGISLTRQAGSYGTEEAVATRISGGEKKQ
jgi:hypothetical protein